MTPNYLKTVFFKQVEKDVMPHEGHERKAMNFMSLGSFLKNDLKFMKYKK